MLKFVGQLAKYADNRWGIGGDDRLFFQLNAATGFHQLVVDLEAGDEFQIVDLSRFHQYSIGDRTGFDNDWSGYLMQLSNLFSSRAWARGENNVVREAGRYMFYYPDSAFGCSFDAVKCIRLLTEYKQNDSEDPREFYILSNVTDFEPDDYFKFSKNGFNTYVSSELILHEDDQVKIADSSKKIWLGYEYLDQNISCELGKGDDPYATGANIQILNSGIYQFTLRTHVTSTEPIQIEVTQRVHIREYQPPKLEIELP